MLIKKITFKNFKSYGNLEQVVELKTDNGELILLMGRNGTGKSALIETLDYTLYKAVKGKKAKKLKLTTLPNRINKELLSQVEFVSNGTEVLVKRGQNPGILELWENGVVNDRAGKVNIDKEIEKYIGMDFETFKSFISMSINDFKNFINLSNEEKKLLLDKLFNLETINTLNDILKTIVKQNKKDIELLDREIDTLDDSISSINRSIKRSKEKQNLNIESDIENTKTELLSYKEPFQTIQKKIEAISTKDKEIRLKLDNDKKELVTVNTQLRRCLSDIDLYENDQCPTCAGDLTTEFHDGLKNDLVTKKDTFIKLQTELRSVVEEFKGKKLKLDKINRDTNSTFNDLKVNISSLKKTLEKLNENKNSDNDDLTEFSESIDELETKKKGGKDKRSGHKDKVQYHKSLSEVFSEKGVKKSIIKNIIKPINHFVAENLKKMRLPFEVELDDQFSATITQLGEEIEHESLSTGETKKVNIAILIAYLKLIRTKRSINVLFLDEVFASIDIEGIDDILELLRDFANEYNINIFLVHHAMLDSSNFDRIIQTNKAIFSSITEIDMD